MKHFTFKWLKRLWALIAVKLIIIAVLLTAARVIITSVDNYKAEFTQWVANEHNISVNIEHMSAGIDFSGLVLSLQNVNFDDAEDLPFDLQFQHLFLHLDFLASINKQKLVFNDISLKGANLTIKPTYLLEASQQPGTESSDMTLDALRNVFLSRLHSFSVKDSTLKFTDHLNNKKTIYIQDLGWLNQGHRHQGVGKASLLSTPGNNTLEFVIDLIGDNDSEQLMGKIYAAADNLNATEYLAPQINPLAEIKKAVVSFKLWGEFDLSGPKNIQLAWGDSQIAWAMLGKPHDWKINAGMLQGSYQNKHWLFDSYDLNIAHNYLPVTGVKISGEGQAGRMMQLDMAGVNLNSVLPFGVLFSRLSQPAIEEISALEVGGELTTLGVSVDKQGEYTVSAKVNSFNNQAVGAIPGISHADITVSSNQKTGDATLLLPQQNIYFDGQFSRPMPIQKGDIELSWSNDHLGFELKSEKALLKTDDLDSTTQFSLLFPSEEAESNSPFLSLYTYASLNDGGKAQYYYPIKAMGEDVFEYLQPTLKKGTVDGAKILWYGAFSDYPYQQHEGIFQAWVPVKNAQYDFYGDWEGLTNLDLDLLFENDYLLMDALKANLGEIKVGKLSGIIDRLHPQGVLTIKAEVKERAAHISKYLIESPLADSVGNALKIIRIDQRLDGNLKVTIPFDRSVQQTHIEGEIGLTGNDIDIELASDLIMPLKGVKGKFTFLDGDLTANKLSATLFEQALDFSFSTKQFKKRYHIHADMSGQWSTQKLSRYHNGLAPLQLSGALDWQGEVNFDQIFAGGYKFDVNLESTLQGVKMALPAPYNKHELQSWPFNIKVNGDHRNTRWDASIPNKLQLLGELNYQSSPHFMPYMYVGLGQTSDQLVDYTKQVIRINEEKVNLTEWVHKFKELEKQEQLNTAKANHPKRSTLIDLDNISIDIKHAELFEQPFINFNSEMNHSSGLWEFKLQADNLLSHIEYRSGVPERYNIQIEKLEFPLMDLSAAEDVFDQQSSTLPTRSDNLREDYPEVFLECKKCTYKEMNLSPLKAHFYPSKSRYTIDYLRLGGEDEFTTISGVWDQRRTNIIVDSRGNKDGSIVQRFGYTSPMKYEKAELSGALNWVGAPWQFNLTSLNGAFSSEVENGLITEVNDKGARLLSFLSLDGIRRSLNLEFDNVFSKGLGFDTMSMSANITNGILKSDDYYLNGSAGKVTGGGLIDLPNLNVNYHFSYSPAVTSSLPVLAAFVINPLTGAAVLVLSKLLEPVVDTIIRVDFSVKGSLNDPIVKIESREKGKVKLQNSEVLEELESQQSSETEKLSADSGSSSFDAAEKNAEVSESGAVSTTNEAEIDEEFDE